MTPRILPDPARLAGSRLLRLQSDERLVALVRDGHEAAFAVLVQRYRDQLERYAERIVGPSRAEDVVQQAFVNAHRGMLRDDRELALKAWLYRITHNAALNLLRKDRDEVALDEDGGNDVRAGAATADVAELRARLRETLDAIAALPAPQRDAILLRELEGRSHDEIALALGITAGAARQQVMRARTSLRAAMSALTPYPLLAHLASSASSSPEVGRATAEAALGGAGAGAVLLKLTAGVATTGALASAFAVPALREEPRADGDRTDPRAARVAPAPEGPPAPAGASRDVVPAVVLARAADRGADDRVSRVRRAPADDDRREDDEERRRDHDNGDERRHGPGPTPAGRDDRREDDRDRSGADRDEDDDRPGHGDDVIDPPEPDDDDRRGSSGPGSGDAAASGEDDTDAPEVPDALEAPEPDVEDRSGSDEGPDDETD